MTALENGPREGVGEILDSQWEAWKAGEDPPSPVCLRRGRTEAGKRGRSQQSVLPVCKTGTAEVLVRTDHEN